MNTKELNKNQIKCLFNDILSQKVKRFGRYSFGKYGIYINNKIPLTNRERVDNYYILHPDKMIEHNKRRSIKYGKRKEAGLCVKCGKIATHGVFCKRHMKENKGYVMKKNKNERN